MIYIDYYVIFRLLEFLTNSYVVPSAVGYFLFSTLTSDSRQSNRYNLHGLQPIYCTVRPLASIV